MQTSEVKKGAAVKWTRRNGDSESGKVESVDTTGLRGAFAVVKVDNGGMTMRVRPSALSAA